MSWNWLLPLLLLACTGKDDTSGEGEGEGEGDTAADVEPVCEEPSAIACADDLYLDLSLHDEVSDGAVETTEEGDDFVTKIDASAGGFSRADENPWVYIKFTPTGAEKVEITDDDALESMDWDLSARRFILRLNGGDSGPSCVGAMALLEDAYEDLGYDDYNFYETSGFVSFAVDDYYTDDCTFVNDSSGLEGSPQVALSAYWEYPGCVAMTDVPFFVQLADGHIIKLRVETYYESDQDYCDETGGVPSDGGYITLRWAYVL